MTMMMLGVAIGFAPYAGYGWATFEVLSKDYGGPVRVQAAQKLANDPDPETREALVKATSNKNWKGRAAALEALAATSRSRFARRADAPFVRQKSSGEMRRGRGDYSPVGCKRIRSPAV